MTTSRSPLHDRHAALGARFVDFGGWEMPVQYESVLAEHHSVREGVGVFDVSHLGRFQLVGPGATAVLRRLLCNDVDRIQPGRAQYTMLLNERGGVEDDVIVLRLGEDDYWVNPNGANYDEIRGYFEAELAHGQVLTPRRDDTVMLAVQGPNATEVISDVLGEAPGRFRVLQSRFEEWPVVAAGTGYTGERGGELIIDAAGGSALLDAVLERGATPCGLGSRDTLRLEMGYPLWGQDLDETTTPLEADLGWVVDWDHDFVGRDALLEQQESGLPKRLVGFVMEGRRFPRHGYAARCGDSDGVVASANFSPELELGIGMAYLSPPPSPGCSLEVEIRGEWHLATVASPPFLDR
jgi:aminomethyltransferase